MTEHPPKSESYNTHSTAVAFPGLPIIFAEGFGENRVSLHGHISLALSTADGCMRSVTAVGQASRNSFLVDGLRIDRKRGKGMLAMRDAMVNLAGSKIKLAISSVNSGILTGSSDSGAAALAVALNGFLALGLSIDSLHELARYGSETAYRSLYGGLSEYYFEKGVPRARVLLPAGKLKDIAIYAVPFDYPRHSADELHSAVVRHPGYRRRIAVAEKRIKDFKKASSKRDFNACLRLMEDDARQVHGLFEDMGCRVRKEGMLALCKKVESWRSAGLRCYWNVAGGSVVYVFSLSKDAKEVRKNLKGYKIVECRPAGPAAVLS
ncbi:MAG: hypothetical protein PHG85_00550 [Candidatus Altiarchaeota archaeon]|nr:hypothetical protein [Candidatus Altiarchaeota archaeon]